ncbi:proline dehydrogenase family protein [candidate division KSB1 bacterium]|nr:proline dehydrogenase family protein [candidate division KSB1 bacterium]
MSLFDKLVVWTIPIVPKFLVRKVAARYIAGTNLADAVQVIKDLQEQGCCATLDVLGEHIDKKEQAEHAVQEYLQILDKIEQEDLDCNISIKLTMLGLKLDLDFCLENTRRLVQKAKELGNFVRIDMEDSSCTTDTLQIHSQLKKDFDNVGFVIQAYMRRSLPDIRDQMNSNSKINVRVCKGIYIEPRDIAYKDKEIVNSNYSMLLRELLENGNYAGIATHDEKLVWAAYKTINDLKLSRDKFEFQMLLGVDEQLRRLIIKDGYKLRVYVPYGKQWYEYSIRRLQENPKIAGYVIKNFLGLKK